MPTSVLRTYKSSRSGKDHSLQHCFAEKKLLRQEKI